MSATLPSAVLTLVNREGWLTELARRVEPLFRDYAPVLQSRKYRVTCGWPCRNALGSRRRTVGECHALESSKAGIHEIFVSPLLDAPLEVAGTLAHELAHVVAGIAAGHGKGFVQVCRHVGLTRGRPTCVMPGEELEAGLERIVRDLGDYPHQSLAPVRRVRQGPPNVVGLECPECGCRCTMGRRWLLEAGLPACGCGTQMEVKIPDA